MGYSRHIGRVGALAVALGVGLAITAPGVAFADSTDSTDSSSTSGDTASGAPNEPTSTGDTSSNTGPEAPEPADPVESTPEPPKEAAETPSTAAADTPTTGTKTAKRTSRTTRTRHTAKRAVTAKPAATAAAASTDTDPAPAAQDPMPAPTVRQQSAVVNVSAVTDTSFATAAALTTTTSTPTVTRKSPNLVKVVSDFVAGLLHPLLNPGKGSPIQIPILTAVLSAVRDEFDRILAPKKTAKQTVSVVTTSEEVVDPTKQHVLVIGVDGTNLSRILADSENDHFLALMNGSTTAASSIVGHTTISNPSWTSILTGVWGERAGVINNVFTPWTYDKWPTVFNQLEGLNSDIDTMSIANWNVINAISGAGSLPVDVNTFIGHDPTDTDWSDSDDAVGAATIAAIAGGDAPNFLFSYFVGVDENGHLHGGASDQYRDAIRNVDENLGDIMGAISAWETANPGDKWTVIVVTDHGHQPQKGFGHGFQSPDETATFVIAKGPAFGAGLINQNYSIVDTTPTVVTLFGGIPRERSDGVPLMDHGGASDPADLKQALLDAIATNKAPGTVTQIALSARTIFATIPYYVHNLSAQVGDAVPGFLVIPVQLVFGGLYVVTNVPAQIVARLTGVTGARIFPLWPPAHPDFPPADQLPLLVCLPADGDAMCGPDTLRASAFPNARLEDAVLV